MASKPEDPFAEEFVVSEEGLKAAERPGTANTVARAERREQAPAPGPPGDKKPASEKPGEQPKAENALPKPGPKKKSGPAVSALNKYAQYDKYHPLNQPFPAIEDYKGPKCTLC